MLRGVVRSTVIAVLACTVLASLTAASAGAAPAWLPALDLSAAGHFAQSPQVGVDPQGNAVAVWTRFNGTNYIVQGAVRQAGSGVWQAPVDLSAVGGNAVGPQVAVDPQGNAVAVWIRFSGTHEVVQSAVRPAANGVWQAPVDVSVTGADAASPQVAVDPQGNAVAVWTRFNGPNFIVQGAVRPAGSGVWQTPVDLSAVGGNALSPQVAVDPHGNAVAVWSRSNGANEIVQGAVRPAASGLWQTPVDLSAVGGNALSPQVAVDPQGNAVAIWERSNGTNFIVQGAVRPAADGLWQAPVDLSAAGQDGRAARVALDPQGNAVAVWHRSNGANTIVQGAVRPAADGLWQTPVDLSAAGGDAQEPGVSLDPQGNAVAVWRRYNGTNDIVQGAVRAAASGAWQAPVDLSPAGLSAFGPEVALDPQGNAVAVWYRNIGANTIVQGAGYDAAGPLLRALSIPSSGVAGQPLSFSVSPLDVWSALGSTSWGFGDGTSATGLGVTHAFAGAGGYHLTLTSADVLGNATSTFATVTIAPTPIKTAKPPPPALSSASMTNKRFRVGRKNTAISAKKTPVGTSFRFTLSATARVQITFTRLTAGLRRGRKCLAPSAKLRRAHAKRCTRTLTVGRLTRSSRPKGASRVAFSGRIGHRAISPRHYKAVLSASNAGGRSTPVTLSFTVVR
jgi:hypothetical protein